jgi:hypothetical protein
MINLAVLEITLTSNHCWLRLGFAAIPAGVINRTCHEIQTLQGLGARSRPGLLDLLFYLAHLLHGIGWQWFAAVIAPLS